MQSQYPRGKGSSWDSVDEEALRLQEHTHLWTPGDTVTNRCQHNLWAIIQMQGGTGSQRWLEVTPRSSERHIFPFLWSRGSLLCLVFVKLWNEVLAVGVLLMPAVLGRIWLSSVFRIILPRCPYKHEHTARLENNSFPSKFLEKFCFFSGNICLGFFFFSASFITLSQKAPLSTRGSYSPKACGN